MEPTAEKPQERRKNQLRHYASLTGIAFQMGATIFLCAMLGRWLDEQLNYSKKICTLILVMFGLGVSMYSILRQLRRLNNKSKVNYKSKAN